MKVWTQEREREKKVLRSATVLTGGGVDSRESERRKC